ncbi:MAG: NAD(P)-dependent oxidoreductase [Magnetococcales bacterium]|nr:NAD(P)-dependent oxidoreductase [Magnetococcales bacterium]
MQTILVTGAGGFLGSHLADRMLDAGWRPMLWARRPTPLLREQGTRGAMLCLASEMPDERWMAVLAEAGIVVHCAGVTHGPGEARYREGNERLTRRILARLRPGQKVILIGSQAAAGPGRADAPRKMEETPAPVSCYGHSKLAAEREVAHWNDSVILRCCALYGPRDRGFLPMFQAALQGLFFRLGREEQWLQMLDAGSAAQAVLQACSMPLAPGPWFVAPFRPVSMTGLRQALAAAVGRAALRDFRVPPALAGALAWGIGQGARLTGATPFLTPERLPDFLQPGWCCDAAPFVEATGWQPEVGLEEGLAATLAWYRRAGWLR